MQQPVTRFCPTCATDVEDVGGFCMLGHSLKVSAPSGDMSTLRAEVDAAFEEAKLQVAAVLGGSPGNPAPVSPAPSPRPALEPLHLTEPPPIVTTEPVISADSVISAEPVVAAERAPIAKAPPPPPPNGIARIDTRPLVVPPAGNGSDPITAFSPPPHMDWGPRRKRFGRRK